ncbi:succinylglutamate desuccinylase/aspartoacylase family protein [Marivirga sp.]|uniref:succinylglutamate desuccinylase/aspartoacylase family protein n=1 Tax=Marivirga sp. TaxID=2018662 RepID=UPI0025E5F2CF|nr:succinylglutamate desuccinylase/aspartoacylase family protein [Marivirga sp.]
MVLTAGIHGNEPAGVFALNQLIVFLQKNNVKINGNLYAIAGNLPALEKQERFHQYDLNRLWTSERMLQLQEGKLEIDDKDTAELVSLYKCISDILKQDNGPFYFLDFHTTSCETMPFVVMNDSLLNRKFTNQYPLPTILGIEEYLEGPLLSYINELGYVAFGFEAGQHDDNSSIQNHFAFSILSLVFAGLIEKDAVDFNKYYATLAKNTMNMRDFYEILYRYKIKPEEDFRMNPGYVNFELVEKGQKLASSNNKSIYADSQARIFMPLYQAQGSEGFFAIQRVSKFALKLSAILRKIRVDRILPLLPGVSWSKKSTLRVNRKVARFFTKDFFHLLGYRSKRLDKNYYLMKNREIASREEEYKGEDWYSNN